MSCDRGLAAQGTITVLTALPGPATALVPEPIRRQTTRSSIRHPAASDQTDTDPKELILGVDTYKDSHVAAVIRTVGGLLGSVPFSTTADDYRQLLSWVCQHGVLPRAGVEGTDFYGTALTRYLHTEGISMVEVNRPDRATRHRRRKTDAVDAEAAALAVLAGQATATAKTDAGSAEMARMFKLVKASAVKAGTQAINQLQAVLVCAEPTLRESPSGLGSMTLIRRWAALQVVEPIDVNATAVYTLAWPGGLCSSPKRSATSTSASLQ